MKNCQVLICLEKYKAINPIVSDPVIDGVAIIFFVFAAWVSTMTLLRVDLRVYTWLSKEVLSKAHLTGNFWRRNFWRDFKGSEVP